jgi:hypothetical protein
MFNHTRLSLIAKIVTINASISPLNLLIVHKILQRMHRYALLWCKSAVNYDLFSPVLILRVGCMVHAIPRWTKHSGTL